MPITIDKLSKSFGSQQILFNFSIQLPDTGVVCLFGASGSGKTTLLNLVAGIVKADGGSMNGLQNKRISFVFQDDRLLPWVTAQKNIEIVMDDAVEKKHVAESWLEQVGLADAAEKKPDELSGGMRQRINIARALAFEGNVLLLDEPFKGLDPAVRKKIMTLISRNAQHCLTLLVTHSREEAVALSDSIYFLSGPPLTVSNKVDIPFSFDERMENPVLLQAFDENFI